MNSATMTDWFRVEVSDGDGQIVAIESEMLAGRDIGEGEDRVIRKAIAHLSGFIGSTEREALLIGALEKCAALASCNLSDQQREITDAIQTVVHAALTRPA